VSIKGKKEKAREERSLVSIGRDDQIPRTKFQEKGGNIEKLWGKGQEDVA